MVFLTTEMPQWLLGIFAAYTVVAVLVVIAQPFKPKNVTSSVANRDAPSGAFFNLNSLPAGIYKMYIKYIL